MTETIDALLLSYFEDVDRWHNDHLRADERPAVSLALPRRDPAAGAEDLTTRARLVRQSLRADGQALDFPRFLSRARYGTTGEYRRYHSFTPTQLFGSYFRSLLADTRFDVRHVNAADRESLGELAERYAPRWIFLSTSFLAEAARITDVCQRLRAAFPDAGLAVGGLVLLEIQRTVHRIAFQHMLQAWGADAYVITPNGEQALLELLELDPADVPAAEIPTTWVRRGDAYALSTEADERAFPIDEHRVRWSRLDPSTLYHAVITRTARSCAFHCSFCTFPALQGGLSLAAPETLRAELEELRSLGTVRSLLFTDDTFNVPPKRFKELLRVLADFDFEWYSFLRVQFLDADTAKLMRDAGCRSVFLGIESVDDAMLKRMGKPATRAAIKRGIDLVTAQGIATHANFIIGFPGDVPENTELIPAFLDDHDVDFFCVSPYYHSPTAPVEEQRAEYGIEGRYWRWKHATMDVERAIELEKWLLDQPTRAVFVSELAHDTFWGEAVLHVNGWSVADVQQAARFYNRWAGRPEATWAALAADPEYAALRALLERRPMPVPPGVRSTVAETAPAARRRGLSSAPGREPVDALFFSYFAEIDRWHNDLPAGVEPLPDRAHVAGASDRTVQGRRRRQSVHVDGRPYDLPRFLSWVRHGSTAERRRWDAYTPTHLSGSLYESLGRRHGFDVRHVNYADRLVVDELRERFDPRVVLFSTTMMIEVPTIMDGLQRVRRAWPDATLVVGGFILGELQRDVGEAQFQRFLRAWGADAYVVSAGGEEQLLAILGAGGRDLAALELPHTYVRGADGALRVHGDRVEQGLSMEDTYVRWSELDPATLYHTVHTRTARSCTFKCSFCSLFQIEGPLSTATPETLRAELEELSRVPHVRAIVFTDDTFNVPHPRFKRLLDVLADFDFHWYSFFRCQFAEEDTVKRMVDSGCRGLFLGLEAVDDRMLEIMNKASKVRTYRKGLEQLARHGISCHGNFIVGFPGDVPENAQKIVDFVDDVELDFFSVSPWFCAPSTSITAEREKWGIEGNFFEWKHDTMDSRTAIELEQWMIKQPKRSTYVSQLSADTLWTELLLYENGYSKPELVELVRIYNDLAGTDTPATELRARPEIARLRALLERHPMAPPAGREVRPADAVA